jgi:hypothetical protein
MATLVRKQIAFPEITEAMLEKNVARQAEHYLGYRFGERRNTEVGAAVERRDTLIRVQSMLKRMGIIPLDEKRVLAYQKQVRSRELRKHPNRTYRWRMVEISDYTAEVPSFALDRATRVAQRMHQRMPSVKRTFAISELVHHTKRTPHPDPFMVLTVLDQHFYLDVWDEPDFEGRRTV